MPQSWHVDPHICPYCQGTKIDPEDSTRYCPECNGHGELAPEPGHTED